MGCLSGEVKQQVNELWAVADRRGCDGFGVLDSPACESGVWSRPPAKEDHVKLKIRDPCTVPWFRAGLANRGLL